MREIFRASGGFVFCLVIASCYILSAQSQSQSPPPQQPPAPSSSGAAASPPKSPAQAVGLFVYPQKEQDSTLQSKDEKECYDSAKQQSGIDPANLAASTQPAQPSNAPSGGGVKGAAGGAAAGAAVGAIAGDAGTGAAAGATAGAIHGRRQQKKAKKQAQQQAQQQQASAQQQNLDTFKRAMSACLDSRGYSVK
ncbi:MAG TPA: glycine zipper domain-containing protein [Terracidiphilus sp.]|nr:glycine zipper domain-containing protein [Terracidiphilus sp.]